MKKLTQKLVLSVITMALVVVALGTSTFAWFTLQNTATLEAFNGQVTSGEGIEVSLGDFSGSTQSISTSSSWVTVITSTQIKNRLSEMYVDGVNPLKFSDVTSVDGKNIVLKDGSTPAGALSGKYVQFNLYFRSNTAKTITLTDASFGNTAAIDWPVDVDFKGANDNAGSAVLASGSTVKVAARQAARVSVFGSTGATYELSESLGTTPSTVLYNSNALPSVSYASGTEFGAAAYAIAKGNPVAYTAQTIAPTFKIPTGNSIDLVTLAAPAGEFAGLTPGYFYGQVTVRVWIEGWDADAFDALFKTNLFVDLKFGVAA
ncbi:hypothetical protein JN09_000648 [Acholeplasma morum]|uniref:hypothetical protein n=1 Tax=Paracholeplasma morum TaxID=264637 RepID=UPI00195C7F38|nr:hypothetical protein [Paracholeplasma morum]MBM7453323.1 hypothetical protein [Paracholeplasma morum]